MRSAGRTRPVRPSRKGVRLLAEHAGRRGIPWHDDNGPRRTSQNAECNRPFPEPPKPATPIRAEDDDVDVSRVRVKDDHASGIAVLLLDPDFHPFVRRTLPKLLQVLEPFARTP